MKDGKPLLGWGRIDGAVFSSHRQYYIKKNTEEVPRLDKAKLREVDIEVLESDENDTLMAMVEERNNGVCIVSNTNS